MTERESRILQPGRNCWTARAPIESAGLLVDAKDYYRAVYQAARAAKHSILIAGWKFNSNVRLLRGDDAQKAGEAAEVLSFFHRLCQEKPDLRIYMLAWDYSVIFSWEWEWSLQTKFSTPDGRMQFRFDNAHAVAASHHQKFIVVDQSLAFVGGLDLNLDDWDDREHRTDNTLRDVPVGSHPYHDIQGCFDGEAAQEVARYFQKRWTDAGHDPFELPPPSPVPMVDCTFPIHAKRVALSRNEPRTIRKPESVLEIKNLYLDAIQAADRSIYIENQYFTSQAIELAMVERMRAPDRPLLEIAVVLPKQLPAVSESAALEPLRLSMLDRLESTARETGHRFGVYYSTADGKDTPNSATLIHSKLMTVDDRFLTVGSANTSNRSMDLDTELNMSFEAEPADGELMESIRRARADLLAEHCGLLDDPKAMRELERTVGLIDYLDQLADSKSCRLRRLDRRAIVKDREWLEQLEQLGVSFDPSGPLVEQIF